MLSVNPRHGPPQPRGCLELGKEASRIFDKYSVNKKKKKVKQTLCLLGHTLPLRLGIGGLSAESEKLWC